MSWRRYRGWPPHRAAVVVTARGSSDISSPDLYVQIPAYRDRELVPTLRDLYARASRPGRLRVRVMWQRSADEVLPDDVRALPRLEIDEVSAATSEGCNWARLRLQESWAGERYTLLLDSHHRFVDGWDDLALEMVEQLRAAGTCGDVTVESPTSGAVGGGVHACRSEDEREVRW